MAKLPRRRANAPRVADHGDAGFWNRPAMMNLVADILFLLAGFMLLVAGAGALQRLPVLPLRTLVVTTPLQHVSREQIEQTATTALTGNFLTIDLAAAQHEFSDLPWVRRAAVRRHWPDTIELAIEEHDVVARWPDADGESRLLNSHGEVFAGAVAGDLPRLVGADPSAAAILTRYRELSGVLADSGRRIAELELSSRGAWRARLADGLELALGRDRQGDPVEGRLRRFIGLASTLGTRVAGAPRVADLRYPNGFAVRLGDRPAATGSVS